MGEGSASADQAISARVLPPEEWGRLNDPHLQALPPEHSMIVVVERGGEIVAQLACFTTVNMHGLWLAEGAGTGVARALLNEMARALLDQGVAEVITQVDNDPVMEAIIEGIGGGTVPGRTWFIPVDAPETVQ